MSRRELKPEIKSKGRRPERGTVADDFGFSSRNSLNRVAPEEGVVFDAFLPEVLGPIPRRKIKLDGILVSLLRIKTAMRAAFETRIRVVFVIAISVRLSKTLLFDSYRYFLQAINCRRMDNN